MSVFLLLNDASTVKRIEESRINRRNKSRQDSFASNSLKTIKSRSSSVLSQNSQDGTAKRGNNLETPYWLIQSSNVISTLRSNVDHEQSEEVTLVEANGYKGSQKPNAKSTYTVFETTKQFDIHGRHASTSASSSSSLSSTSSSSSSRLDTNLSIAQKEIRLWHAKMKHMLQNFVCHHRNLQITLLPLPTRRAEVLFTKLNIAMLRYTYFDGIRSDWDRVLRLINHRNQDGSYMLSTMRKTALLASDIILTPEELVAAGLKGHRQRLIVGMPLFKPADTGIRQPSSSSDDGIPSIRSSSPTLKDLTGDNATFEQSHDTLNPSVSENSRRAAAGDPNTSIQSLLKRDSFWDDVYKDLKFDAYLRDPSCNYFGLMPSSLNIKLQLVELIDYFLNHLTTLDCDATGVTDAKEVTKLSQYSFVYLPDFGYGWLDVMALSHVAVYHKQWQEFQKAHGLKKHKDDEKKALTEQLAGPSDSFASYIDEITKARGANAKPPIHVHYMLLTKFHHALSENVKFHIMPEERDKRLLKLDSPGVRQDKIELCVAWNHFLRFVLFELLSRDTRFVTKARELDSMLVDKFESTSQRTSFATSQRLSLGRHSRRLDSFFMHSSNKLSGIHAGGSKHGSLPDTRLARESIHTQISNGSRRQLVSQDNRPTDYASSHNARLSGYQVKDAFSRYQENVGKASITASGIKSHEVFSPKELRSHVLAAGDRAAWGRENDEEIDEEKDRVTSMYSDSFENEHDANYYTSGNSSSSNISMDLRRTRNYRPRTPSVKGAFSSEPSGQINNYQSARSLDPYLAE